MNHQAMLEDLEAKRRYMNDKFDVLMEDNRENRDNENLIEELAEIAGDMKGAMDVIVMLKRDYI
jgi:hypothetical protein